MASFCYLCTMKLHIFNPEHDLALAANQSNYTAPHAGRQLRNDLSFIPALWADKGDFVLVDDIDSAYDKVRHLGAELVGKVEFITKLQLEKVFQGSFLIDSVHPWGWDKAIVSELKRMGCPEIMLPTDETLEGLRCVSGRKWAASHLQKNVRWADNSMMLSEYVKEMGRIVVKAPWSCSGRGVRYFSQEAWEDAHERNAMLKWADHVISKQGCVTVEPYYNKVKDFGMEFEMIDGVVEYRGLSLFQTVKNAYTGNLLVSEEEKLDVLKKYTSVDALNEARQMVIDTMQPILKDLYHGPFGVDMMICSNEKQELFVNSCIELNLRRTMGHVALALGEMKRMQQHLMRVDFDGNRYHLNILPRQINNVFNQS